VTDAAPVLLHILLSTENLRKAFVTEIKIRDRTTMTNDY
jgi:hypothetical protein